MKGFMSHEKRVSKSYRDLPEWQKAHADYLAEHEDPDIEYDNRIRAAYRLWEIERNWHARD